MALLFDANHLLNRLVFANTRAVVENPLFVAHLLTQAIVHNLDRFGSSRQNPAIIALDSPSWRKAWYEENIKQFASSESYKGNRKRSSDIPWNEIFQIYGDLMADLNECTDLQVVKLDQCEADDIIAIATRKYKRTQPVWIVSSDKDFLQEQEKGVVSIWDPVKRAFKPECNVADWKKMHIMMGDGADNIPACRKKLGEKTAMKLLKDLDKILATDPDFRARYEFNRTLIDFDYIPQEIKNVIGEALEKPHYNYNSMSLLKVFGKYKLNKMAENVNKFKLPEQAIKTKYNAPNQSAKVNDVFENSLADFF